MPWNTGSPAFANDDGGYDSAASRHNAPELCINIALSKPRARRDPQVRARGMPGARCTRSPCAKGSVHTVVTTVAPEHPAFPHAMVLTAYAVLSPATNSSCHRHRRIKGFVGPGWARITSADLAPATGARTTRFCRTRPVFAKRPRRHVHDRQSIGENGSNIVRLRASIAHGKPPCDRNCAPDAAASTASHPNVRDDRDTPLQGDETAWNKPVIWVRRKDEIFLRKGLGTQITCSPILPRRTGHDDAGRSARFANVISPSVR